jgi:hypothetical protein
MHKKIKKEETIVNNLKETKFSFLKRKKLLLIILSEKTISLHSKCNSIQNATPFNLSCLCFI